MKRKYYLCVPYPGKEKHQTYLKMNIERVNREDQSVLLHVTVGEKDFGEAVEKTLRDYKRKANVPGFRPGMVPMGIVKKMYGKGVTAEEAYKAASQSCFDYIQKEKIDYVGDVIPAEEQKDLDFEKNTEHEFVFELGLAPKVEIELTDKDKVTKYQIKVDDKMRKGYMENFLRRFGRLVDVDKVAKDEALEVTLDNEQMQIKDAYVGLISMGDDERKPFIGKKVGATMDVDVNELYKSPAQRASVLQVKEDELAGIDPKFKLTITRIRKFAEPEMNEEFFKEAFPGGEVKDQKGLDAFIDKQIEADLERETAYIFNVAVRKMLLEKTNLRMPEAFLRRWLFAINEGKFTMEQINADMPAFLEMMRWNLIQKYYAEKLDIKIDADEAKAEAREYARQQFAQYGMANISDDVLDNYADQILANQEEGRKVYDRLYERKVIEAVSPLVKVANKSVTADQFNKAAEELMKP